VAFEKAGARRVTLRAGPARAHHRLTGGVGSRSKRPPPLNAFKPEIFFSPRAWRYAGGLATDAGALATTNWRGCRRCAQAYIWRHRMRRESGLL